MIAFSSASRSSISVIRATAGSYINGRYQKTELPPITLLVSVQALSGRELENLPEGQRNKETIRIYSVRELKALDEKTETPADLVIYADRTYEIKKVTPYRGYYKAIATAQ